MGNNIAINKEAFSLIEVLIDGKMNIVITGLTESGKDTTMEVIYEKEFNEGKQVSKEKYYESRDVQSKEDMNKMLQEMILGNNKIYKVHGDSEKSVIKRHIINYMAEGRDTKEKTVEMLVGTFIDFIIMQENVSGKGIKIVGISEVNYNSRDEEIEITPIYEYNYEEDTWEFKNKISSMVERILTIQGIRKEKFNAWA